MSVGSSSCHYALGSTDAEHERLIWQAERLAPLTERLFREAGIGPGQRVLDVGSGVGDVAMLVSRLVGPAGEVVGIERDPRSIARARVRVGEAGLPNVSFIESDVSEIRECKLFDAAVGRFILGWLPDPVSVLRSLSLLVRPGGVVAFQESGWAPVLSLFQPLPLWSSVASLFYQACHKSGADLELGYALYHVFQEAGLPGPAMRLEVPLGNGPDAAQWFTDILRSLWPVIQRFNLAHEFVGNLDTLSQRLLAEVEVSKSVVAWMAPVGAWARK